MYHTRYQKVIRGHSESGQRSKMERFGKIIVDFNYLCKKPHHKSFSGYRICARF